MYSIHMAEKYKRFVSQYPFNEDPIVPPGTQIIYNRYTSQTPSNFVAASPDTIYASFS
jgi:hypothetical protein